MNLKEQIQKIRERNIPEVADILIDELMRAKENDMRNSDLDDSTNLENLKMGNGEDLLEKVPAEEAIRYMDSILNQKKPPVDIYKSLEEIRDSLHILDREFPGYYMNQIVDKIQRTIDAQMYLQKGEL